MTISERFFRLYDCFFFDSDGQSFFFLPFFVALSLFLCSGDPRTLEFMQKFTKHAVLINWILERAQTLQAAKLFCLLLRVADLLVSVCFFFPQPSFIYLCVGGQEECKNVLIFI